MLHPKLTISHWGVFLLACIMSTTIPHISLNNDLHSSSSFIVSPFFATSDVTITLVCPSGLSPVCSISEQPPYADLVTFSSAGNNPITNCGTGIDTSSFNSSEVSSGSCPITVSRTYRLANNCGEIDSCIQLIIVNDIINPVMASPPGAVTVECIAEIPSMTSLGWTDNCDGSGVVLGSDGLQSGGNCGGTIMRSWTYTDACGNAAIVATQVITIDDTTVPVMASPPGAVTVECIAEIPSMTSLGWTDNCDGSGVVLGSDGLQSGGNCGGTITRSWTYTDACGNAAIVATQVISIDDTTVPVMASPPGAVTVECIAEIPSMTSLGWTDNCDGSGVVLGSDGLQSGGNCGGTITRSWTYTDACGNAAIVATQVITIDDTTVPVMASPPGAVTVECIAEIPSMTSLGWTDNCDGSGVVLGSDGLQSGGNCGGTITRSWTYTDACGNAAIVATQVITIDDTTVPVMASPPGAVTVECIAEIPSMTSLGWTDNCDGSGVVLGSDGLQSGGNCGGTITRSWTYTDACGNAAIVATQVITIDDTTVPVMASPPGAVTVECIAEIPSMTSLGWTDNCDGSGVVLGSDGLQSGGNCGGTITRSWTYTDACGNAAIVATQVITIDDTTVPVMASPPGAVTVECIAEIPSMTSLGWTDNCDGSGVVLGSDGLQSGGNCGGTITRSWTYTDACGNAAIVATQVITIDDTTVPVMASPPGAVTVECIAEIPSMTSLGWTDNCDGSGVVLGSDGLQSGGNCGGTITRSWTYTDACGNAAIVATQVISIDDTTVPVMASPPGAVTVECIAEIPSMTSLGWTDNCDGSGVVLGSDGLQSGGNCGGTIMRSWTYTDACGNAAIVATQVISIDDTTVPVMASPPAPPGAVTVECIAEIPSMTSLGWTDNCDGSGVVLGSDGLQSGGNCGGTIMRSWTYTDACGNAAIVATQVISIDDTTVPVMASPPGAVTVECIAEIPSMTSLGWTDNCDGSGVVLGSDGLQSGGNCGGTITRSWTYTDACGNAAIVATQVISIDDTTVPVMASPPGAVTVECIAEIPSMTSLGWTDNCDGSGVVLGSDGLQSGGNCGGTIMRSWTYTDACGNAAIVATQVISIDDTTVPVMASPPADVSLECIPNMISISFTDNCDGSGMVLGIDVSDGNTCPEVITRSWVYSDACANKDSVSQIITLIDNTPPVITCPVDISVNCPTNVPPPDISLVTATDNCNNITIEWIQDLDNGHQFDGIGNCPNTIFRSYRAVDNCGNAATCIQEIFVTDECIPGEPCPLCDEDVPFVEVDLQGNPDSAWISLPIVRDGQCCTTNHPDNCVQFRIILDEDAIGFVFGVGSGANPDGSQAGQISCGDPFVLGEGICLTDSDRTFNITVCKPGSNAQIYGVISFGGLVIPGDMEARINCDNEITVSGVSSTSTTWTSISPGAQGMWDHFLDCTSGCLTNTVTPDSTAPSVIVYEVCGDYGSDFCGTAAFECEQITVTILPDVNITIDSIDFCGVNTEELTPVITPLGNYTYEWYSGPNGTGTLLATTLNYLPTTSGTYSFIATEDPPLFECDTAIANVQVSINPLPLFVLGADPSICLGTAIVFDLPDDYTYVWTPPDGVVQGTNPGDLVVTPPSGITYTVTGTSNEGCITIETIVITAIECLDCPSQVQCTESNIVQYNSVSAFVTAGGVTNYPCSIPDNNIAFINRKPDGNTCPEIITDFYEIWDSCDNRDTCGVIVTLNDTINPTITCPSDITLDCGSSIDTSITGIPIIMDDCNDITLTFVDDIIPGCSSEDFTINRTFTVTDLCGNIANCVQSIALSDQTAPVFASAPSDVSVECIGDVPVMTDLGWTDNCDGSGTVTGSDVSDNGSCPELITRTWTYTDSCGNASSVIQTLTIGDNVNPTASNPGPIIEQCAADVPTPDITVVTDEDDNCTANPVVAFVSDMSDGMTCPETITRTYSVTDECLNQILVTQTITIGDNVNPTASNPGPIIEQCAADVPTPDITVVTDEDDNCTANPVVAFVSDMSDGMTCPETITRTYSVTDECLNQILVTQTITIGDLP